MLCDQFLYAKVSLKIQICLQIRDRNTPKQQIYNKKQKSIVLTFSLILLLLESLTASVSYT